MGRMNIYLTPEEDKKLDRLKDNFNIKSKEEVIKRLIKRFSEEQKKLPKLPTHTPKEIDNDFDAEEELKFD